MTTTGVAPHVRLELRPYQIDVLDRIAAAEARGVRKQLVVMGTGLGKTICFCALAERRGGRTLILAHRDELVSQAVAKVREVWPGVDVGIVKAGEDRVRAQVVVASVQTLARSRRLARLVAPFTTDTLLGAADPFDLVVVDECHHATSQSYRGILDALRAGEPGCTCGEPHERTATPDEVDDGCELGIGFDPCPMVPPGPLLLGVTATPDRGDGKGLDDIFDEIVASYDLLWGIGAGYLADMRGRRVVLDDLDLGGVKVSRGDYDAGATGRALEAAGLDRVVADAWQREAAGRRTLIFTPTVETAGQVATEMRRRGIAAAMVHGGTPLDERRATLRAFGRGEVEVVVNCMVLGEGFDEPRTDCIVIARPTRSRSLYCFDDVTEVLTPRGWRRGATLSEGDEIAAFDMLDDSVRWEPVQAHVERPLLPGERMMSLRSPSIDMRVTDTHRMVWRPRTRDGVPAEWAVMPAGNLAERQAAWELPVAGWEKAEGVPLTDAELAFVGWVQTDGCVNRANGVVQIDQQRPEQCDHIEAMLDACGFKWRVSESSEPTNLGPRRHPCRRYRVSRGAPRGEDKHLRGWGALAPWLPKADPAAWSRLEAMDDRQWAVLLEAWHRGDGSKHVGQPWTQRSYHLAIADEWVAGWVQSMCIRRGWRANVAPQANLWFVHCRPVPVRHVGGAGSIDRSRLVETPIKPGERVWCVSVASGALFVRRNGKVAVAGNSQMCGRASRRHPDKADALILDIVGASAEHSLVTLPSLFGVEGRPAAGLGDGSALVSGAVAAHQAEMVALGRMRSEEAELFGRMRSEGIAWVAVHRPGELRRYERSLGKNDAGENLGTVVLAQRQAEPDLWTAGLQVGGEKRVLLALVDEQMAQGVAEDYCRKNGRGSLVAADAAWRRRPPSPKQRAFARKVRLRVEPDWTAGELSDALDVHLARRRRAG